MNLETKIDIINQMKFKNLDSAFKQLLHNVYIVGLDVNSRGSRQKELLFSNFVIEDPTALMIHSPHRKFSVDYATAEWLWYLSANPRVNNIGKLAKIWVQIQDDVGEAESNYGCYLKPQWDWVIDELLRDRDTRRATIVINQPHHKGKNKLDYPCTHYLHFFVRENKLHLGVNMRSNDIIFGLCNDVFTFCMFQQLMLNELNARGAEVSLGSYHHHAGSLHLYERHFSMAEKIVVNSREIKDPDKFILDPDLTWKNAIDARIPLTPREASKDEIKEFVKLTMEKIYV